jgi:hypothetical protein
VDSENHFFVFGPLRKWLEKSAQLNNGIEGISVVISSDSLLATILNSIIARVQAFADTSFRSVGCAWQVRGLCEPGLMAKCAFGF